MKNTCPNCNVTLDKEYVGEWSPNGQLFRLYMMCNICSFGYPIDWRED